MIGLTGLEGSMMAKPNVYRCTCNGEIIYEGTSAEIAEKFHFDRFYVTRMARFGLPIGSPDGTKKYLFEIVGYYSGSEAYYFSEPLKPKTKPEPKPKKRKAMTTKEIVAAARAAGMSYGYYVATNGV